MLVERKVKNVLNDVWKSVNSANCIWESLARNSFLIVICACMFLPCFWTATITWWIEIVELRKAHHWRRAGHSAGQRQLKPVVYKTLWDGQTETVNGSLSMGHSWAAQLDPSLLCCFAVAGRLNLGTQSHSQYPLHSIQSEAATARHRWRLHRGNEHLYSP